MVSACTRRDKRSGLPQVRFGSGHPPRAGRILRDIGVTVRGAYNRAGTPVLGVGEGQLFGGELDFFSRISHIL
jgi:hypothetical protein